MRQLKTTQGTYNGPIYRASGAKCHTVKDIDLAMLDTRAFWEERPPETQKEWIPILQRYQQGNDLFPPFPVLTTEKIQLHLLHTKDSAPGLDGIPYAAWRLNPSAASHAIYKLFLAILQAKEEPPSQVLVWIPKATAGPTGEYFRPLGMPNTSHRVLDGAIASLAVSHCSNYMHPSQSTLNHFREPQKAVLLIQQDLDDHQPNAALFIDMAKAFEKVNPHWAVDTMQARGCPAWLIQYAMYLFTGRRVWHKVGPQLLPPRVIRQGVDMGRAFSVFMFCLAMDPIYWYLNQIPRIINVKGYVDDCTVVGSAHEDLEWAASVRQLFGALHTAGFQITEHNCWKAIYAPTQDAHYPPAGHCQLLTPQATLELEQAAGHSTCIEAIQQLVPQRSQAWERILVSRCNYYYKLPGKEFRALVQDSILTHNHRQSSPSLLKNAAAKPRLRSSAILSHSLRTSSPLKNQHLD